MTRKVIKAQSLKSRTNLAERVKAAPAVARSVAVLPDEGRRILDRKSIESRAQAEKIVEQARAEASRIRAEAEGVLAEVGAVREEARKSGFNEGRGEGLANATEYAVKFQELKSAFYKKAEPEIIKLVLAIAEKVIGKMVHEHGEAIRSIVRQAIESSLGDRIIVRLNPEDYKLISADDSEYRDVLDRTRRLTFKEDETITKGGCVVETEVGTIDAQLETQLKAIRKALEL